MEYTLLPKTDLKISRIILGCQQFSGTPDHPDMTWPSIEEEKAIATIHTALGSGVNSFDCKSPV